MQCGMRDDGWSRKQHTAQSKTCSNNMRHEILSGMQGRLSSKQLCKQRVGKNLVLVEKEERLGQKRRKTNPRSLEIGNIWKKQKVEGIDGEICCHLLIPINYWNMHQPASGDGKGDVGVARTLERLFSRLVLSVSLFLNLKVYTILT